MVNIDIIVSVGIFAVCFAFFIYGKIHRSIVALVGACSMVIFGSIRGFYTQHQALEAIDFDTLGLLFGMMSIVAILKRTGFFRYIAIKGTRMAKGNPWKMLVALSLTTGFLSMIIDNVTTILLITPVSLLVSDILGINPLPILIGEVTMSNIGGFATLVGDPPNIMIASASSFGFNDFVIHLMPISLLCMFVNLMLLKALSSSLPEWKEKRLQKAMQMSEKGVIKEKITLIKCIFSLVVVVILFVTEEFHNLKPSFVAIIGAVITLMLVGSDPREVFSQIEWTVLLFFAGLFVLVGGVDRAGFLKILSNNILNFLGGDIILTLFIIWSSFILSSVIDNIP
ncbi:anion permease, partial [Candidatus Aerophobetes bacterium]|nr:anion permease [Candidatus Aerophobetes bacterium]